MSDFNSQHNRVVWVDIPVADLPRSAKFYSAVLGCAVHPETFGDFQFAVIEHSEGNGGCLVLNPAGISSQAGPLIYLNVNGRIREAAAKAASLGGSVVEPPHSLGPHGFRALILDSEGNRIALHSQMDA